MVLLQICVIQIWKQKLQVVDKKKFDRLFQWSSLEWKQIANAFKTSVLPFFGWPQKFYLEERMLQMDKKYLSIYLIYIFFV